MSKVRSEQGYLGKNISFAASEAYKLLRTNLILSMPDNDSCKVVGVTSSIAEEGKSTTALNLAFEIANAGYKVLLLECDLRKPSLAQKLGIDDVPEGLTNYLTSKISLDKTIFFMRDQKNLSVIFAGEPTKNPSELLYSDKMQKTIQTLKSQFDYIVIDFPPLSIVSDALVFQKMIDGIIVTVRSNMCTKRQLKKTIAQLNFLEIKIIGIVNTYCNHTKKRYYKYKYSNKYKEYSK